MTMNAQRLTRQRCHDLTHHAFHVERQRAAVRLTQVNAVRTRIRRRAQARQRIGGIAGIAVEEMLGVEHDPAPGSLQVRHRFADHAQVLVQFRLQCQHHLLVPRLAHDGDHRRAAFQKVAQALVVSRCHALAARAAERRDLRMLEAHVPYGLEEGDILGVAGRKSAFDEVDAELVQPPRDQQLVLQ